MWFGLKSRYENDPVGKHGRLLACKKYKPDSANPVYSGVRRLKSEKAKEMKARMLYFEMLILFCQSCIKVSIEVIGFRFPIAAHGF